MCNMTRNHRLFVGALAGTGIVALSGLQALWADSRAGEEGARLSVRSLGFGDSLLIQVAVSDLDRAIAFYRDVLGFELFHRNDSLSWAKVRSPVTNVVIGLGASAKPKGSGTLTLNFTVRDIERTRKLLEERGVTFTGPTMTIPGVVKLADFADPDGNRIRLAQGLNAKAG